MKIWHKTYWSKRNTGSEGVTYLIKYGWMDSRMVWVKGMENGQAKLNATRCRQSWSSRNRNKTIQRISRCSRFPSVLMVTVTMFMASISIELEWTWTKNKHYLPSIRRSRNKVKTFRSWNYDLRLAWKFCHINRFHHKNSDQQ